MYERVDSPSRSGGMLFNGDRFVGWHIHQEENDGHSYGILAKAFMEWAIGIILSG